MVIFSFRKKKAIKTLIKGEAEVIAEIILALPFCSAKINKTNAKGGKAGSSIKNPFGDFIKDRLKKR